MFLRRLFLALRNFENSFNDIRLKEGGRIHSSTKITRSEVKGVVIIGEKGTVHSSRISGAVTIGENGTILNSSLSGNIHIGAGALFTETRAAGNVRFGKQVKIVDGVSVTGDVMIGDYTSVNGPNTDFRSNINPIRVGKFCSIARNVSVQENNHYYNRVSTYHMNHNLFDRQAGVKDDIWSKGSVEIGNDVWIGTQSVILSGVRIGNGAVVAANSVVAEDIPAYAIAAGSPAKIIKYRFPVEIIDELESLRWWDWSEEKIRGLKELFQQELTPAVLKRLLP